MTENSIELKRHTVAFSTAKHPKKKKRGNIKSREVLLDPLASDEATRRKNTVLVHGCHDVKIEWMPDRGAYDALYTIVRTAGNHLSLSSYIEETMRCFRDMRSYTGFLGAKRREGNKLVKVLDQHLTVLRGSDGGVWTREFDEDSVKRDGDRDLFGIYQQSKPVIVDLRAGLELEFTNMDHESNRCCLRECRKKDGLMKAYIPLPYGGEGSRPIGLAVMEGDLAPRSSRAEGFAKLFLAGKSVAAAAAQIAQQIMNRFDSTTNLMRKLDFQIQLEKRVKTLKKGKGGNSYLLLIDLDAFKGVNENYGYLTGDALLKLVGEAISSSVRGGERCIPRSCTDIMARFGGDEFLLLFSGEVSAADALGVAKRINEAIAAIELRIPESRDVVGTTCSIGVVNVAALVKKTNGMDAESSCTAIFESCDKLLKKAKRTGKNRTYFSDGTIETELVQS